MVLLILFYMGVTRSQIAMTADSAFKDTGCDEYKVITGGKRA